MRLTDLVQRFTSDPRYITTAKSRDTYEHCLGQFIAYLMHRGIENTIGSFDADNVESFVQYLFERGLNATSVNLRLSALSGLAKYGMQQKLSKGKYVVESNPVDRIKRPRNSPVKERFLSLAEVRALLAVESAPNERLALMLIIDQPLRASEICEAKVRDLTLDGDKVALNVRVKGGRFVTKVLGERVAEALVDSLRQREAGKDEAILLNQRGMPYNRQTLSEMISRVARRAGITRIEVRAHVIRHSIASMAAASGASPHELAAMLNHSGTATVKRYVHGIAPDAALARVREALHA